MEIRGKINKPSLFDQSGQAAQWLSSWVMPYFGSSNSNRGVKCDLLEIEDLHRCSSQDEAAELCHLFEKNFNLCKNEKNKIDSIWTKFISHNTFIVAMIRTFKYETIAPFLLFIVQDVIIKPVQPVLIGLIIRYFYQLSEGNPYSILYCLTITTALCISSLLLILAHHPSLIYSLRLSMRIKVVWSTLIYNKCLQLSANSHYYHNLSKIVNLMTNDVRRFDEFSLMANYLLIVPLQTVLILVISWYYIGLSCLATFGAFLVLAYFLSYLSKHFAELRTAAIVHTEKRLQILDETFRHLRAIKIYALENQFLSKIIALRRIEICQLKIPLLARSITLSFSMVSSRVILYFTFLLYLILFESKQHFYPETVFVSVTLFERLRYSLTWTLPQAISGLYDILAASERMDQFLKEPIPKRNQHIGDKLIKPGIHIEKMNTKVSLTDKKVFQLKNIDLCIENGENLLIIGPVGSGKTTLLLSLLSEVSVCQAGRFAINGSIAYASQEVYCLGSTIRENIIFGRIFDRKRYEEVLEICALNHDLSDLPLGDQTLVGECGFTLSGGQKARISLARALYSESDIYLLDDPFSAVDAHLAQHIYQRCIQTFLRNKCVVIATHQLQFVPYSTRVLLLDKGQPSAYGSFESLIATNQRFIEFFNLTKHSQMANNKGDSFDDLAVQTKNCEINSNKSENNNNSKTMDTSKGTQGVLSNLKSHGEASILNEYWHYLKRGSFGFGSIWLVVVSAILSQTSVYFCDHWLTLWNKSSLNTGIFLAIYTAIVMLVVILAILRSFTFYELCHGASENVHNQMSEQIIKAPIAFFDHFPQGKLLNYFTRDVGVLDETLPSALFELNLAFSQVVSILFVILFMNPYMSTITFFYIYLLFKMRHYYAHSSHVLRRFEVQARNSIFAHLSSTLNGLSIIRAYSVQDIYRERMYNLLNDHTSTMWLQISSARFFCMMIDLLSFVYIIVVLLLLFIFSSSTNGQLVGLCLGSMFNLIGVAQWAWKRTIDSDLWIMSYQNLSLFENLPNEEDKTAAFGVDLVSFDVTFSRKHLVEFRDLSVYYSDEMSGRLQNVAIHDSCEQRYVLRNINLQLLDGQKVGICGRSGSGKSSLVNALLQLADYTGEINIDGIEVHSYSLSELRRHISIIPQYPVIFNGSIRENLDLLGQHSDHELWNVLERVQLRTMIEAMKHGLDEPISVESQQMSVGQKQLICLARIMLQNNWLIILDEATANVDFHTDKLIQQTIRRVFEHCTVITIAHRLDSIIDCDRILVFDGGRLIEDDTPRRLLGDKSSHFAQLVRQTGSKMAARLEASVFGQSGGTQLF